VRFVFYNRFGSRVVHWEPRLCNVRRIRNHIINAFHSVISRALTRPVAIIIIIIITYSLYYYFCTRFAYTCEETVTNTITVGFLTPRRRGRLLRLSSTNAILLSTCVHAGPDRRRSDEPRTTAVVA
jgi:hypothetical protein